MKTKLGFFSLLAMRSIIFLALGFLLVAAFNASFHEMGKWWTIIVLFVNMLTLGVLFLICRHKKTTYAKFVNYEKGKVKGKTIFFIVIIMAIAGMGGMQLAGLIAFGEFPYFPLEMMQPIPLWIAIGMALLLPITTTLAEDGVYLGVINQDDSIGVVVGSAFFYALQHSFIPFFPDVRFMLYRFLSFLIVAIIMCFWYRKNKNPLPFMVGHFVLNLATVAQIIMITLSPEMFG